MSSRLTRVAYSFPVQLLLLQLKKHHFLLLFWILLTLLVTSTVGSHYGVNYLYLAPEYMGRVDFWSYLIIGAAFGGFMVAWNITSYILHAHRFPFLATLTRPFGVFCFNNSVIPIIFFSIYCWSIYDFQRTAEIADPSKIATDILGLLLGLGIALALAGAYFFNTNRSIFQVLGLSPEDEPEDYDMHEDAAQKAMLPAWRVDTYVNMFGKVKLVRPADHYDLDLLMQVYRQHHSNAVFVEITWLAALVGLGLLIDVPVFLIPAGASVLILFGLLLTLTGAFSYWVRGWRAAMYLVLIGIISLLTRYDLFNHRNQAYGLTYETESLAEYSLASLEDLASPDKRQEDTAHFRQILENWRDRNPDGPGGEKPKMVLLNSSGGGLRAALFNTCVLQTADSLQDHQLMNSMFMMTGASGGMLGSAYYRELVYREQQGESVNRQSEKHRDAMSGDLLNSVTFTIVVNDLFFPWQKFETPCGREYRKDRGYMLERQFNKNTGGILDKSLAEYRDAEFNQEMPLMILAPTIINDGRKLFISPHQLSFLSVPPNVHGAQQDPMVDGYDFMRLFGHQSADDLRMTSALRMNATFPYILPSVALPTEPPMEVMDAGLRDNFGLETSTRMISVFREWILENTSGVVIMEIRGHEQFEEISPNQGESFFSKIFSPVSNLYSNWNEMQDYQHDYLIDFASEVLDGKLDVLVFEYTPAEDAKKAAVSFHLTSRERKDIIGAIGNDHNQAQFARLQRLVGDAAEESSEDFGLRVSR